MITTIVLKILLIIIAVIVILLHFSLTVYIKGGTSGELVIKAKYLGITLYPRPKKEKKKKQKKRRKPKKQKEKKEEDILGEALEEVKEESLADDKSDDSEDIQPSEKPEPVEEKPQQETAEEKKPEEKHEDKPAKSKAEKRKKREKKEKKEKPKKEKPKKEKKEKGEGKLDELKRKWEFIKPYLPPAWKYTKKLLKAIRLDDVKINIVTGKEDAAESATFYGKLQAALFSTLNFLAMVFTLNVSEANVRCVFNEKRLDAEGETTVRVRPSTVIAIAFCLLFCAGKIFIPYKLKQRRARKKAEKAKKKKTA